MRKALLRHLDQQFHAALCQVWPGSVAVHEVEANGHLSYRLATSHVHTCFLAIQVHGKEEIIRLFLVWSRDGAYPAEPESDMLWSRRDYLAVDAGEMQLAVLDPTTIPWDFPVDEGFVRWRDNTERAQTVIARGMEAPGSSLLSAMLAIPPRCSIADAKRSIDAISARVAEIMVSHVQPFMEELERARVRV